MGFKVEGFCKGCGSPIMVDGEGYQHTCPDACPMKHTHPRMTSLVDEYTRGHMDGLRKAVEIVKKALQEATTYGYAEWDSEKERHYMSVDEDVINMVVQKILSET